jgi:membrane protease YdiL (CAAX protease family)
MKYEPAVEAYVFLYAIALIVAIRRRKVFPLGDALMVTLIVGVGFSLLSILLTPPLIRTDTYPRPVRTSEIVFMICYLIVVAGLLIRGAPMPAGWRENFVKKLLATLAFKLAVFVLVPLVALRLFWQVDWFSLGFSGTPAAYLASAAVLILLFGGFNLLVGGAAAPIRRREYALGSVLAGLPLVFLWNTFEVGLVEEFFFRGFLQGRLAVALGSPLGGIAIASLLFGLAHVPGIYLRRGDKNGPLGEHPSLIDSILYAIVVLSPTGWFTGLLYWRTQSLLVPILVHAAVDAVAHTAEFLDGLGVRKQAEGDGNDQAAP